MQSHLTAHNKQRKKGIYKNIEQCKYRLLRFRRCWLNLFASFLLDFVFACLFYCFDSIVVGNSFVRHSSYMRTIQVLTLCNWMRMMVLWKRHDFGKQLFVFDGNSLGVFSCRLPENKQSYASSTGKLWWFSFALQIEFRHRPQFIHTSSIMPSYPLPIHAYSYVLLFTLQV